MLTIKKTIAAALGLYLCGLIILTLHPGLHPDTQGFEEIQTFTLDEEDSILSRKNDSKILRDIANGVSDKKVYTFQDPALAIGILKMLDIYVPLPNIYSLIDKHSEPFYGIKPDDNYCSKHRKYFVYHADKLFEEINLFLTYPKRDIFRTKVLPPIANDIHPEIGDHMPKAKHNTFHIDLKPEINIYFSKNPMYANMYLGQHFSCLTQSSNHIPGHGTLDRKDNVAKNAITYAEKFKDRLHCFNHDKFFPETWILPRKADCEEFFKKLNSPQYETLKKERHIVYIRKIGVNSHRGEGVQPVDEKEEAQLRKDYDNGALCGSVKQNYIIQTFIHNPLLLNGHKFDFRMYMLIASTNPLIAFYHDGFLRVTLANYDPNSSEKSVLLTNLALNKQIYDDVKGGNLYEGMDEESLKIAQQWSFERLKDYLLQTGKITDPNWLDNYLRPEFKKAMIHLLRLSAHKFHKDSTLFELYGVDFMLDENLNLWFIEANSSPALYGYSKPMEKFIVKMLQDHLKVVQSLLRSRMKRIILYINDIVENNTTGRGASRKAILNDPNVKKAEFAQLIKNKFEDEFLPGPDNGFSKILDENEKGVDTYQGFITQDCL